MAQSFSTGPVDLWVGIGSGGAPVFLGHSEDGYEIQPRPQYENVMNDLAGIKVPYDRGWQGADAMLLPGGGLTRWNEPTYAALQCYQNPGGAFAGVLPRGRESTVDRGALMGTEGLAIEIWMRYPYSSVPAFASLPAGYHFIQCVVEADSMKPGSKAYKIAPSFYSWPKFLLGSGFILYNHDVSALGAIN